MDQFSAYLHYALKRTEYFPTELAGLDKLTLKSHQLFVARIFLGIDTMNSLLLFQETGVGKTVTVVYILKQLKKIYPYWTVIILLKKALVEDPWMKTLLNFAPETVADCIILNYDDPYFPNKFFAGITGISRNNRICLVIDESHNFISRAIVKADGKERRMRRVYNYVAKNINQRNNKILCLSATPVVNEMKEFKMLVGLLRPNVLPEQSIFASGRLVDAEEVIDKLACICSYVVNNESSIFEPVEASGFFVKKSVFFDYVPMSEDQEALYRKAREIEIKMGSAGFRILRRLASTLAYKEIVSRRKMTNEEYSRFLDQLGRDFRTEFADRRFSRGGLALLARGEPLADADDLELYNSLYAYSCKFVRACAIIKRSAGKCLVFEPFVKFSGISVLLEYFRLFEISHVEFSSRTRETRTQLVVEFNAPENTDGELIKACVFSASGNEGISFMSINDILILDMTWNESSLKQIIGRALRLNSHVNNISDRRYLNVHFIVATLSDGLSVDQELLDIIQQKSREFNQLYSVLKRASIEYIYANYPPAVTLENEKNFQKLISRPVEFSARRTQAVVVSGESVWYSFSSLMTSIHKGFKHEDRIYDTDGNYVATLEEDPTVRVSGCKLVYIVG
ncbi:ORF153 [Saltwater crocodilepox virus]|nr:ORF153 [Saltwater crocodilepox virus]QGT47880.1 ORF153 [Saltwater crocodilepox virus]QGT48090.1 ORF153 [Saltwater crocodilepox virus]QGT48304.1 ORF153 [Saltwater crocodilepox virus]QGT48520.1 ORF153 [Saltwater crocodilepox virus]